MEPALRRRTLGTGDIAFFVISAAAPLMTLPAGYRPLAIKQFAVPNGANGGSFASLEVSAAGVISSPTTLGSAGGLAFDGITFPAEQ